jgi:DNA-binding SARP family transcriptional activator
MATLTLTLLGGFQLRSGADTPVPISAKKCKALLSYLALYPGMPHSRDKLAALLWEESSDPQARHSLRQALASLRRSLPPAEPPILIGDAETLAVRPGAIDVDVLEFERLAATEAPEALARAAELYRGELLEGFNPRSAAFEDWLMHEQSRLRERALGVMEALLAHYRQSGATERAIQLGLRLLALDPLREPVHRTLMELYAKQGRHGAALKQYRLCRGVLQRELAVAPEPATERLYREILQGRRAQSLPAVDVELPGGSVPGDEDLGDEDLASEAKPPEATVSELRQVTVLSVSLAGTDERLDPEEAHALVSRYHEAVDAEIERYGGRVVQRMGSTALAAFGVPVARSNDPERAVHAADAIRRAIPRLMGGLMGAELQARIGVASGRIMVGQRGGGSHPEYALTGEAVNLAGTLSVGASAGEILLSDGLYHSVAALIAAERPGPEREPDREQGPGGGCARWARKARCRSAPPSRRPACGTAAVCGGRRGMPGGGLRPDLPGARRGRHRQNAAHRGVRSDGTGERLRLP